MTASDNKMNSSDRLNRVADMVTTMSQNLQNIEHRIDARLEGMERICKTVPNTELIFKKALDSVTGRLKEFAEFVQGNTPLQKMMTLETKLNDLFEIRDPEHMERQMISLQDNLLTLHNEFTLLRSRFQSIVDGKIVYVYTNENIKNAFKASGYTIYDVCEQENVGETQGWNYVNGTIKDLATRNRLMNYFLSSPKQVKG